MNISSTQAKSFVIMIKVVTRIGRIIYYRINVVFSKLHLEYLMHYGKFFTLAIRYYKYGNKERSNTAEEFLFENMHVT